MGAKRRSRSWDDGATTVEAAIIFSILITLIYGIIQFGLAFWQWNTMMLAVQQVGRYAMINNATVTAGAAETQMQNVLPSASVCTLSGGSAINPPTAGNLCVYASTATGTAPDPSTITLTAVYAYNFLGISGTFTVASQGTFPLD
jgi:Flp pilus assembly protein TadG